MKKTILTAFIALILLFSCMFAVHAQDDTISVYVNETELICDVAPYIESGRTMVPMRAIFEALDAVVEWEDATQTITANKYGKEIVLQIGSQTMTVNGTAQTLDVAPVIINSRTFVPLRAVSQALNASVEWFDFAKRAYINSANTYEMDVFVMGTIYAGFNYTKDFSSDIAPDTKICSHGTVTGVLSTNGYIYAIADNLYSPNEKIMISICADDMTDYNLISKLLSGKTISFAGTYTSCDETGDVHSMNLSHIGILQPDDIIFLDHHEMIYPDVSNLEEKLKAEAKVTIYSPYSAPSVVFGSEVQYYLSQGWYLEPVTIIYDYYGNKSIIYEYELNYYLSQGWTTEPVLIIYDYQGNPSRVLQSEVPYYISQGWSTVPPVKQATISNTTSNTSTTSNSPSSSTVSQSASSSDNVEYNGRNVYRTPNGKRYHYSASCAGKNASAISLSQAISSGLTGCNSCVN